MSKSRHERISQIVVAASVLEPQTRDAFLDAACGEDAAMRDEAERLLENDRDDSFLESLPVPSEEGTREALGILEGAIPDRVGPYRILGILGEGGMGTVYLALQEKPVRRQVALKCIKPGLDSRQMIARFEAERQALAMMNHPCIANVYDAGVTDRGHSFFVMEHVAGTRITDDCDHNKRTISQRLELFFEVCGGVQHAHQKGVIHRDLKPSNILITMEDGRPIPKIIDFGVAKATHYHLTEQTILTRQGEIIGTPEYMSPEQAKRNANVDTRSDIYSLGVLLYELITGVLPFDMSKRGQIDVAEIQRIREEDPPASSLRLSRLEGDVETIARLRRTDPASLIRRLRYDLDWITLKALEKDPSRRYASASEMATDIRRHLDDEPVLAGPPSRMYQLRKFARKHRGGVTIGALVFSVLVVALIAVEHQRRIADRNLKQANLEADAADRERALAQDRLEEIERLADAHRLLEYQTEAEDLWPPHPRLIGPMRNWVAKARTLAGRLETHRATLKSLRENAVPGEQDGAEISTRSTWRFEDTQTQWQHDVLARLVTDLERFVGPDPFVGSLASVAHRLAFARSVEEHTVTGTRAAQTWREALKNIETLEVYRGLKLRPQIGLLPIGNDPDSGLCEFVDLQSGEPARRGEDGNLVLTEKSGIVLVLIPGGTFHMGAQPRDRSAPNYDIRAQTRERPVLSVTLDPFFISKYEVTQGQWLRVMGRNPSTHGPEAKIAGNQHNLLHPVEGVSWHDCSGLLRRLDFSFLTEAQWEYAARAGTETRWWTGENRLSLLGAANVSDLAFRRAKPESPAYVEEDMDDGYAAHAPVGIYRANPFGLHDMHGNLYTWCRDWYTEYTEPPRSGDGLRSPPIPVLGKIIRGGCYREPAFGTRSTVRGNTLPRQISDTIGLRPGRRIAP